MNKCDNHYFCLASLVACGIVKGVYFNLPEIYAFRVFV
jgi:hypothetical protein